MFPQLAQVLNVLVQLEVNLILFVRVLQDVTPVDLQIQGLLLFYFYCTGLEK